MKILGIDTSSKFLSLAVTEDSSLVKEENILLDRKHSSLLVPKIKEMLDVSGLSIRDIDAFIVGLGPGSFTGLRIGVSAVKGFGTALSKPCVGVASMDAIAFPSPLWGEGKGEGDRLIVPVIDAKRGNVYSAVYKEKKGRLIKKSKYLLLKIDELMKKIKGKVIFLGDGVDLYREDIKRRNENAIFLEEKYWYPRAYHLIMLGIRKIKKCRNKDLKRLDPIYLYPRDCQVKRGYR